MSRTILQVEDQEDDVFFLKRAFKDAGILNPLQVATNGQEAMDYLSGTGRFADRNQFPIPFLMLLDLRLPQVMGLEVLKWLRAQPELRTIIVIVLTSSAAGHVKKLEIVFGSFQARIAGKKCEATVGLVKEGEEIAALFKGTAAINAALVSVAQKLKHCEIASYGCLHEWAVDLGNQEASTLLKGMLTEARDGNDALVKLARSSSNQEALGDGGEGSGGDAKAAKLSATRRGVRPLKLEPSRPPSLEP